MGGYGANGYEVYVCEYEYGYECIVCPRKSPPSIPLTHPARERAREGKAHGRPLGISKTVTGWSVGWFASIRCRRLRAGFTICVCNSILKKNTSQEILSSRLQVRQISEVLLFSKKEKGRGALFS